MDEKILSVFKEVSIATLQFSTNNEDREFSAKIGLILDGITLKEYLKNEFLSLIREVYIDQIQLSTKGENQELATKIELKLDSSAIINYLKNEFITALLRDASIDNAFFLSNEEDREFSATIALKLNEQQLKNLIKNELKSLFSEVTANMIQINLTKNEATLSKNLELKFDTLTLKNLNKRGITIDELNATIADFKPDVDLVSSLKNSKIRIDRLILKISQKWINDELRNLRPIFEEKGFNDIEIVFLNKLIIIRGSYKKGVSFPFSIEIKLGINNNRLFFKLSEFNLMEILPLPQWLQNLIIDFAKNKFKHPFVEIQKSTFTIDILSAVPFSIELNFRKFQAEKEFLILEI